MTDTDFEARLVRYLQARAEDAVEPFDASMIADTAIGASRPRDRRLQMVLAAAVVALTVVGTAGAIVVGGLLNQRPNPSPPLDISSPDASAEASTAPEGGRIVYTRWRALTSGQEDCAPPAEGMRCMRTSIFTSNQDGTDEREIVPGPRSEVITSTPDGSRIIIRIFGDDVDGLYLTDISGSQPQLLDTNCEFPCVGDSGYGFSPDGSRLAFARSVGDNPDTVDTIGSVIAIMDLSNGAVVELDSTFVSNPDLGDPCHANCGEGTNLETRWSPDGERLLFSRVDIGIPNQPLDNLRHFLDKAVFVVDADGGNLRQLAPTELSIGQAAWSPDGSLIVLTQSLDTVVEPGVIDNWQQLNDIYVIRPDGTGLQRLTTDTAGPLGTEDPGEFGARFPSWTRDGRIVFSRNAEQGEIDLQLWVMDSDGSDVMRLDPSDPVALTAIGCVSCPYPPLGVFDGGHPSIAFWIPAE